MKKILLFFLLMWLLPATAAEQGHIKILSVTSFGENYVGNIADLFLEVKPGDGGIFIDTFPITKIDTQISTRFAKEIACKHVDFDCDNYDFFYTLRADSSLIGGPSAGSAAAILTVSVLTDLYIDENTSITGTINSGGIIGPVGGLKAKIDTAPSNGITKVLIPQGGRFVKEDNETIDLVEYGEELGIEVVEVIDLTDALAEFTGKQVEVSERKLSVNPLYLNIMQQLSEDLCERGTLLKKLILEKDINSNTTDILERIDNNTGRGREAYDSGKYYSSASFCFGANVRYNYLNLQLQNLSSEDIAEQVVESKRRISGSNKRLKARGYETITDLQTFMIVQDRLIEANDFLDRTIRSVVIQDLDEAVFNLAYATERIYSARSWSEFFGKEGKKFQLDKDVVRRSCLNKLSEVEERLRYAELFVTGSFSETTREVRRATDDFENEDYELCLFKASKAKAEMDMVLTNFGIEPEQRSNVLQRKLDIAERNIIRQSDKGIFPILGYSYFEYADSLKETDILSSLLYSEYALELSDLDLYFREKKNGIRVELDFVPLILFSSGLLAGILLGMQLVKRKKKRRRK